MRVCKTCGGEIAPIRGGHARATNLNGADLGVGTGPAIIECLECRKKAYREIEKSSEAKGTATA